MSEINGILEKIQAGEISPEEAVDLIEEIKNGKSKPIPERSSLEILKGIETGEISSTEGISMIKSSEKKHKVHFETENVTLPSEEDYDSIKKWWNIPWIIGLFFLIGSGLGMNSIVQSTSGVNFWFFVLLLPLFIGLMLTLFTWPSENRAWIHVRVRNSKNSSPNVKISVPLPVLFSSWAFKFGRNFIPLNVREKIDPDAIELIFEEIEKGKRTGNPLHVHVDEGDGEIVDVYIG